MTPDCAPSDSGQPGSGQPAATRSFTALDEPALTALAAGLAPSLHAGGVIFLEGELGAGKTTFARALLRVLGVEERVKSPTYSLIESYRIGELHAHHLDLYRIAGADELEWLGLADLVTPKAVMLVEWPERGRAGLPHPDLVLKLQHAKLVRDLLITATSKRGRRLLASLS